jgi:sensor domain CHASE-containing protein
LAQHVDSLQLVEGIVTSTADVRGRVYLNFGADYRTDFTVAIAKKHRKRFKSVDPVTLEGARIRVRGWVELMNGPMIWVSHPARIEILS